MKYFIDTEFKEKPNTIDLISIGMVDETGKEFYALNKDVNLKKVWKDDWLNENVLRPIYQEHFSGDMRNRFQFTYRTMKMIFKEAGKTRKEMRTAIIQFMIDKDYRFLSVDETKFYLEEKNPEFYGYYADYDWVVFCWIFGRMIDLPKGMPMYCKDLKQIMDELGLDKEWKNKNCPKPKREHNALVDAKWDLDFYNSMAAFSRQSGRAKNI